MNLDQLTRSPVIARQVVATSQPLASEAGLRMLRAGGNAVDAAIAAAAMLTVVEPTGCGLGSDAFALVHEGRALHGLNSSGRTPAALDVARYRQLGAVPKHGWDSITVPGAVAAWAALSKRFGRLPFADLLAPAIETAERGFGVSPRIASGWRRSVEIFRAFGEWQRVFAPTGAGPQTGELRTLPDHARTLRRIAESRGDDFYRGQIAHDIDRAARDAGSSLRASDLASHTAEWVDPIDLPYHHRRLAEIPPNGQGIAALIALGMLRAFDLASLDPVSPQSLHLQIEAMKLSLADAYAHVTDPQSMTVSVEWLLDDARLADLARRIDPAHAADPGPTALQRGGTVYLATADANGMMVSFIQSNFWGFGSGIVIPNTGIAMQNRAFGFVVDPEHPNTIAPSKRPFHTIIPGMLLHPDRSADASLGIMGGAMQAQAHVQATLRLVHRDDDPQRVLDVPRWRVINRKTVWLERGFPESTMQSLRDLGHDIAIGPTEEFGGGQIIRKLDNDLYIAGSDWRKDGCAMGF